MNLKIGNTSIINYNNIFIKKETDNLSGSIKDRSAYEIMKHVLDKNKTLVIATSGNMGISFSMLAKHYKQPLIVVMPSDEEKKRLIENSYTKVIETDPLKGMKGTIKELNKFKYNLNYKIINQFNCLYNPLGYFPLVKEINNSFKRLDYVICGVGTGGTYYTLSKVLKKIYPNIKILGVTSRKDESIDGIGSNYKGLIYNQLLSENIYEVSLKETMDVFKKTLDENYDFGLSTCSCIALVNKLNLEGIILVINSDGASKYISRLCLSI